MRSSDFSEFDLDIARTRIILSLIAFVSLYIDPSAVGGLFHLTPAAIATLGAHLIYSVGVYFEEWRRPGRGVAAPVTVALDLAFATAIAFLTEGQTSPAYIFFVFAITAIGIRRRFQTTIAVTAASLILYLAVIWISQPMTSFYLMRAVYLAIAGALIGIFGRERAKFESRGAELDKRAEREQIARLLHDTYVQSLAGMNLRLESCRKYLSRAQTGEALREVEDLQRGVTRQYDDVRGYLRSLAGVDSPSPTNADTILSDPDVRIRATLDTRAWMAERVLQIALEGVRNARRHARASIVNVEVACRSTEIEIKIGDDGIGFAPGASAPWTIASYVAEAGGSLDIKSAGGSAALEIGMPNR